MFSTEITHRVDGLKVFRGQPLDPHETMRTLGAQGYQRVAKVSDPGEMTLRGGIRILLSVVSFVGDSFCVA